MLKQAHQKDQTTVTIESGHMSSDNGVAIFTKVQPKEVVSVAKKPEKHSPKTKLLLEVPSKRQKTSDSLQNISQTIMETSTAMETENEKKGESFTGTPKKRHAKAQKKLDR